MVIALTAIYLVLTKCVRRPELLLTAQCGVLTKRVRRPELLLTAQCGAVTQLGNSTSTDLREGVALLRRVYNAVLLLRPQSVVPLAMPTVTMKNAHAHARHLQ
ncbi:hypothetical protein NDU88_011300 [Pleurodeles waltl]|uniref:Secreted protein n=1 Tax=Pleurodeles waltl TaxID=8319 RepID=A0AAV7S3G6_PLEWA|nr:hypothetical protein NDU88_011300 [Pleurodeles waltl]